MRTSTSIGVALCALPFATLAGCYGCYPSRDIHYPTGHVPDAVTNFRELNTPHDDFNAAAPPTLTAHDWLALSTNRAAPAEGNRLQLFQIDFSFGMTDGHFFASAYDRGKLPLAHEGAEFGPLFVWPDRPPHRATRLPAGVAPREGGRGSRALVFAGRGPGGDLDLFVTQPFDPGDSARSGDIPVLPLGRVNRAGSDQAYPSFGPDGRLYLASSHEGAFDIYAVVGGPADGAGARGDAWLMWLAEPGAPPAELEKVAALSSPGDDTAPSILDGTLVFASNRAGSTGGYDLYVSTFAPGGGWSAPAPIAVANSGGNEFRPTLMALGAADLGDTMGLDPSHARPSYDNQLLLFSSDRPGGLGGYDMYYVGYAAPGIPAAPAGPQPPPR
ncbi:MAG: PD40 domain-containing protein [Myxococcales bacterium]|nr:PD40 domain-containing protein [Myxococcales bacterium]